MLIKHIINYNKSVRPYFKMNEQSTKKILFNKSTLLNLKAELIKKQEEVEEKKRLPYHKIENFKPTKPKGVDKSLKTETKTLKDCFKEIDVEELEACKKSKLVLEKKAQLYEHLSDGAGTSQLAGRFLVDFDTKKEQKPPRQPSPELQPDTVVDDDNQWIEFKDCLGRTRKCLKTDYEHYKMRDQVLSNGLNKDKEPNRNETEIEEKPAPEKPLLVQTTNDYLQSLREKWEEREQEMLKKDGDIHYQDVLFDEARMHGVSYFAFSTDEQERRKQMEDLTKTREQTLRAQQESERTRKQRDELIAARVSAARARMRLRAGLPPEDPEEVKKEYTTRLLQFLNEKKDEADNKAKEEARKIREEKEKEREKYRQEFIREWDVGKEGIDGKKVEKFRQMSQEEYVEQQRAKRINEFAPPQTSTKNNSKNSFDDKGTVVEPECPEAPKSWSEVRPKKIAPEHVPFDESVQKGLYFSSVKKPDKNMNVKFRNFVRSQEVPVMFMNEVHDVETEVQEKVPQKRVRQDTSYAEIAPPPTFDYYGPTTKYSKSEVPFTSDIHEAYAQGTKVLEKKREEPKLSVQYDFIM